MANRQLDRQYAKGEGNENKKADQFHYNSSVPSEYFLGYHLQCFVIRQFDGQDRKGN